MYLSNKEFYCEIIISKGKGRLTRKAQSMLILLADKIIQKMKYWNPDDKHDCYQSGVYDMFNSWYNFNQEKSINAFAYFTEIFKRGIARGLNEIHKKKGDDEGDIKVYSIDGSNDGQGMHNI